MSLLLRGWKVEKDELDQDEKTILKTCWLGTEMNISRYGFITVRAYVSILTCNK
jgi:hypothetical protein